MKNNEIPDFAAGRLGEGPEKRSKAGPRRAKSEYNTGRLGLVLSPEVEEESGPARTAVETAPPQKAMDKDPALSALRSPPGASQPAGRTGGSSSLERIKSQVRQRPVVWAAAAGGVFVVAVVCVILGLSGNDAMGPEKASASTDPAPPKPGAAAGQGKTPKTTLPQNNKPGASTPRQGGGTTTIPRKPTAARPPIGLRRKPKPPKATATAKPPTWPRWRLPKPLTAHKPPSPASKPPRPTTPKTSKPTPPRPVQYRPAPPDVHLTAIFVRTKGSFCAVNGRFVRVGDTIERCKVVAIYRRFVEMEKNGQRFLLRFRIQAPPEVDDEEEDNEDEEASDESDEEEEDEDKDSKRKKRKKKSSRKKKKDS